MFTQIAVRDLVAARPNGMVFAAKYLPLRTPQEPSGMILLCLCDGERSYFLFNQMLAMSKWLPDIGDYSEDVFETVVLAAEPDRFESLTLTSAPSFTLDWPGGSRRWAPGVFEDLTIAGRLPKVALVESLVSNGTFEGRAIEFLLDLHLRGHDGDWRVKPSSITPEQLVLSAIGDEGFWDAWSPSSPKQG